MKFTSDFSGAKRKTQAMKNIDKANRYQMEKWNSETVKELKKSAKAMKKSANKTGQLARNVGGETKSNGQGLTQTAVGTGVGGTGTVPYADIQDQGKYSKTKSGVIKARNKKFLTIPLGGTKGTAANFPNSFIMKTSKGNLLICEKKGEHGLRALFLLRRQVAIPASNWFSGPLEKRLEVLEMMVSPEAVWPVAEKMAGG
jgi:hypothetical protein